MPLWSYGVALTPLDTMRTCYTLTGTDPSRWTQTWQSVQRGQFNNMTSAIQKWEGAGFSMVSNMQEVRHPQPQCVPCSQVQSSAIPTVEQRGIQLFRSGVAYV